MSKQKKCKNCQKDFTPSIYQPFQRCCSPRCERMFLESKKKKTIKVKEVRVESLIDTLVFIFHRYIRARDRGKPCPSCGSVWSAEFQAGHYHSAGANSSVRFNEVNVNGQCVECNSGSNFDKERYWNTLQKRWSIDKLSAMEEERTRVKRWSEEEIRELTKYYKEKLKDVES